MNICGDVRLAFKSIGYKSLPVPDLTFDHERGVTMFFLQTSVCV